MLSGFFAGEVQIVKGAETAPKYGPASFAAALINVLLVNFSALMFVLGLFWGYQFYLPFFAANLAISWLLTTRAGVISQIGRGMLIGWLSGLLSPAVFIAVLLVGKAVGL